MIAIEVGKRITGGQIDDTKYFFGNRNRTGEQRLNPGDDQTGDSAESSAVLDRIAQDGGRASQHLIDDCADDLHWPIHACALIPYTDGSELLRILTSQ